MKSRLQRLRQAMAEKELDAFFISQPENRRYVSGFTGSDGYVLVTPDRAVVAVDFRYTEQAAGQCAGFEVFRIIGELSAWFNDLVKGLAGARLGFEADHMSVAAYQQMQDCLKKLDNAPKLADTRGLVVGLRSVKESGEVEAIQKAIALSDGAFEHIRGWVRPGMTELGVAWELEKHMREHGSGAMPFDVIAAAGPNASMPHHHPGDRVIQKGELLLMDFGATVDGYVSDLTRTIFVGGKPDAQFRKLYDVVLGAQLTAIATLRPGMTGAEGDKLARTVIGEAGHGEAFGHGLGHGVGLVVHEEPRVGQSSSHVLTEGMVFTVEPGVYLSGWGGIRIEDVVVLEAGGARSLTRASKDYS